MLRLKFCSDKNLMQWKFFQIKLFNFNEFKCMISANIFSLDDYDDDQCKMANEKKRNPGTYK